MSMWIIKLKKFFYAIDEMTFVFDKVDNNKPNCDVQYKVFATVYST